VKWTKEKAISELQTLIQETHALVGQRRRSAPHTSWLTRTLVFLEQIFGQRSIYYNGLRQIPWASVEPTLFTFDEYLEGSLDARHQRAYEQQLETARGLLDAALMALKRSDLESVYKGKDTGPESSAILKIINLAEQKLRKAITEKPTNEKQVQDVFQALLYGADIEHSREKDTFQFSAKAYRPDFTFSKLDLALDLKFCNSPKRLTEIIKELNDYAVAFKSKYGNAIFVVYDAEGIIRDVDQFRTDIEHSSDVLVIVVKH